MMVSPTDEVSLAAGLAGVQATISSHGERLSEMKSSIDAAIKRIDVVYPDIAALKQQVSSQEKDIESLQGDMKEQHRAQVKLLLGLLGSGLAILIEAILPRLMH